MRRRVLHRCMPWMVGTWVWALVASCAPATEPSFPLRARVLAALGNARPYDVRFSATQGHSGCAPTGATRRIPAVRCAVRRNAAALEAVATLSIDVRAAMIDSASTDALWSAALLDLWFSGADTRTLDRVIGRLNEVHARDTTDVAVLNDLAIAHLVRASDRDDARDLFRALDWIEQAYGRDSTSRVIAFNRAAILDHVHLDRQAKEAWQEVADAEHDTEWAAEALDRHRRLMQRDRVARVSIEQMDQPRTGESGALSSFVSRDPQTAREYVLDTLLVRWSRAVRDGASASADEVVRRARAIAGELLALSGDSSLVHIMGEVERAARDATVRARMAHAVSAAASGTKLFRETRYLQAQPELTSAVAALRRDAPTIADWTDLSLAGVHLQRAEYRDAERIFAAVAGHARAKHALAIEARARWGLALSHGRRGATSETEVSYSIAVDRFAQLGETSNVGFMQALIADIHHALGRSALHARAMYAALDAFHRRADPPLYYAVLLALGQRLSDRGFRHAAISAIHEAVVVSRNTGRVKDGPESHARLALEQARLGNIHAAKLSVAAAYTGLSAVADSVTRARLEAEIARAEAETYRGTDPRRALEQMNRAATYFGNVGIAVDQASTLIARADLELALGDSVRALADLNAATDVATSLLSRRADREAVRLLMSTQRNVYRRLVAVALARGDTMAAFRHAELSREDTRVSRDGAVRTPRYMPPDRALVTYLALDDRLLIWTCRASAKPVLDVIVVRADDLTELTGRFVDVIRQGADPRVEVELGRRLYDLLIAPVSGRLDGIRHLTLVPDAAVAAVPFAGLRDANGRYLIERLSLTYAPRVERRRVRPTSAPSRAKGALLVSDPAWEASLFPDLDRLRSAGGEVKHVHALYPRSTVLTSGEATRDRVLRELPRHALLHFAGHARVTPDEPMSSHLVVARDTSGFGANVVFAADIARLDLHSMRLAVLSACGAAQDRHAVSMTNGLAQAFLDAGVGGVIASQWEADDEGTANLMRAFHEQLRAGMAPEDALRHAQLVSLRQNATPGIGSARTAIWSTFRFSTD